MQRLAIFQLLQSYVDYKVKGHDQIIIAIEEAELFLHPPYKRALYNLFRKISHNKSQYTSFIKALEIFIQNPFCESLTKVKQNSEKVKHLLPKEIVEEINRPQYNFARINDLYQNQLLTFDKFDSISKKEQRNIDYQRFFQETSGNGFGDTIMSPFFTMWEYDFEENISKELNNYNELNRQATSIHSGKPLVAKYIATKAKVDDFNAPFKKAMCELITHIRNLNSVNTVITKVYIRMICIS